MRWRPGRAWDTLSPSSAAIFWSCFSPHGGIATKSATRRGFSQLTAPKNPRFNQPTRIKPRQDGGGSGGAPGCLSVVGWVGGDADGKNDCSLPASAVAATCWFVVCPQRSALGEDLGCNEFGKDWPCLDNLSASLRFACGANGSRTGREKAGSINRGRSPTEQSAGGQRRRT